MAKSTTVTPSGNQWRVTTASGETHDFPSQEEAEQHAKMFAGYLVIAKALAPEGSSRNEGWDKGFAGEGDPYGIHSEHVAQSANPNAAQVLHAPGPIAPAGADPVLANREWDASVQEQHAKQLVDLHERLERLNKLLDAHGIRHTEPNY